jgi:hypothetical protein
VRSASLGSVSPWAPVFAALCVLFGAAGPGCRTSCDDAEEGPAEAVTSGITDASGSVFESTPWDGAYHEFRPQKRYEFLHGLTGRPRIVQAFVAFTERPIEDGENGNVSEAAGNVVIFEGVDATSIRVRNDTCETFYLRVAASAPVDEAAAAGAGN